MPDIHRIVEPDHGDVRIPEKPVDKPEKPIKEVIREKIGFVPEVRIKDGGVEVGIDVKF